MAKKFLLRKEDTEGDVVELNFHHVQSQTYKHFTEGLAQPHLRELLIIMAIIIEPINFTALYLLKSSSLGRRTAHRLAQRAAPISELANV